MTHRDIEHERTVTSGYAARVTFMPSVQELTFFCETLDLLQAAGAS